MSIINMIILSRRKIKILVLNTIQQEQKHSTSSVKTYGFATCLTSRFSRRMRSLQSTPHPPQAVHLSHLSVRSAINACHRQASPLKGKAIATGKHRPQGEGFPSPTTNCKYAHKKEPRHSRGLSFYY